MPEDACDSEEATLRKVHKMGTRIITSVAKGMVDETNGIRPL